MFLNKIILTPILLVFLFLVPTGIPSIHGQLVGQVCLTEPGSSSCPTSPPIILGTAGTQQRVAVFLQGSDPMIGFDITLVADSSILKPAGVDFAGTIVSGSLTVLGICLGGVAIQGNCGPGAVANPDSLELALMGNSIVLAPATGLLFTAIYNVTADTTGTNIEYATNSGCTFSSVSGTSTCVLLADGTPTPVPETIQTASFVTNPIPDFTVTANPASLVILAGTSTTSTITLTSLNSFSGTVTLISTTTSPLVSSSLNPVSVTLSPGGSATSTLTVSTTSITPVGFYNVTVAATSGTTSHTTTVPVIVANPTPADFVLIASPITLTIKRGNSGTSSIMVEPLYGFTGTVNLSTSVDPALRSPRKPTASLASPSVTITVGQVTDLLTITVPNGAAVVTYAVTVTGTSGNLTNSVTLTITVTR